MKQLRQWLTLLCLLPWVLAATVACAHESLPASLMLQETSSKVFDVRWRVPQMTAIPLDIRPRFPQDCRALGEPEVQPSPGARLVTWTLRCDGGLRDGAVLAFDGLPSSLVDVVVRVAYADGRVESYVARPRESTVVLGAAPTPRATTQGYLLLGVEHILSGTDHLLFVLCLILLVPGLRTLLVTITAFTLAHSLTLAMAALDVVRVSQAPVEATIALSILFLARELVRTGDGAGLARRRPWAVALVFGLLHGFGFASALAQVGLPPDDIPLALAGIGIRIEDDVRVTENGCDIFTTAPKTVAEIEEVMRRD